MVFSGLFQVSLPLNDSRINSGWGRINQNKLKGGREITKTIAAGMFSERWRNNLFWFIPVYSALLLLPGINPRHPQIGNRYPFP
jgi:hypothetical protein